MTTFAQTLESEVRRDGARPLVTWYDETTGERVELSVTTYANWVAKTASLLVEEYDLERGDLICVDLPIHWLDTVFLGAAWAAGLIVTRDRDAEAAAAVTGPADLAHWAPHADRIPVLACALLPMGVRFADPLPTGVHDVGVEVWSQPDAFIAFDPPPGDDPAGSTGGGITTHEDLWSAAAVGSDLTDGDRVLIAATPASPLGISAFTAPFARSGGVVLVVGADDDRVATLASVERAVVPPASSSRSVVVP